MKKALFGFLFLFIAMPSLAATFDICTCQVSAQSDASTATAYLNGKVFVKEKNGAVVVETTEIDTSFYDGNNYHSQATVVVDNMCKEKLVSYIINGVCPNNEAKPTSSQ